jgi:thiol:disulfide interchange protein
MRRYLFAIACLAGLLAATLVGAGSNAAQSGRRRAEAAPRAEAEPPSMTDFDVAAPAPAPGPESAASGTAAIQWQTSFDDARKGARAGQLIVVDVYTDWCGWCKYMDRRVYTDAGVIEFAAANVFVKVNAEDPSGGERFARSAGVRGFPTTLVYSSEGRLIASRAGAFRRPAEFLDWLHAAGTRAKGPSSWKTGTR